MPVAIALLACCSSGQLHNRQYQEFSQLTPAERFLQLPKYEVNTQIEMYLYTMNVRRPSPSDLAVTMAYEGKPVFSRIDIIIDGKGDVEKYYLMLIIDFMVKDKVYNPCIQPNIQRVVSKSIKLYCKNGNN